MSDTRYAERELDILAEQIPNSVVLPFRDQILAICEAFLESGQSGMSAPFVATALSNTIKKLLLFEPICDITGDESEWVDVSSFMGNPCWQNTRCSSLFKNENGICTYGQAIVWRGEQEYDTYTGGVYSGVGEFELISSSQCVKFPFKPKTFYVDVIRIPISKELADLRDIHYTEDGSGECYYSVVKNPKQLEEVFSYYTKRVL